MLLTCSENRVHQSRTQTQRGLPQTMRGAAPNPAGRRAAPFTLHPQTPCPAGCKWSPDGLALLTCSEDRVLRLYGVPDLSSEAQQTPTLSHQMSGEGSMTSTLKTVYFAQHLTLK